MPANEDRNAKRLANAAVRAAREEEARRRHWRARVNNVLSRVLGGRQYVLKEFLWRVRSWSEGFRPRASAEAGASGLGGSRRATGLTREYAIDLPPEFGVTRAVVRLSVPQLPGGRIYSFSEHVRAADGSATDRAIACATGGFAISEDLGRSWRPVKLKGFGRFPLVHSRMLRDGEILLQAIDPDDPGIAPRQNTCLLIADMEGNVLHRAKMPGALWHGPRSVDLRDGTLIYAEYTPNGVRNAPDSPPHWPSRVWRSRDFGRSWDIVREEPNIRHFHFLQANPLRTKEWWLTSGDAGAESRIWKSADDGDTWIDQTDKFGPTVTIGDFHFSRRIFRLTDLAWTEDGIIWGSDDPLRNPIRKSNGQPVRDMSGARMFRGDPASGAPPAILGICGPEVRNIVEVGDFHIVTTQSSHHFANKDAPRVFLMSKRAGEGSGGFHHLFDVERHAGGRTGFTYSRASRAAKDGVFFSFRPPTDVFRAQNRILKWQIEFG